VLSHEALGEIEEDDAGHLRLLRGICLFLSVHDVGEVRIKAQGVYLLDLISNVRTPALTILAAWPTSFHVDTAARLPHNITKLSLEFDAECSDEIWHLLEGLCASETGLKEVLLPDFWEENTCSWAAKLRQPRSEDPREDEDRKDVQQVLQFAILFAMKGIRLVDGEGKSIVDYLPLAKLGYSIVGGDPKGNEG
jgi:hypothetical protein